jgi:hypothetical protein
MTPSDPLPAPRTRPTGHPSNDPEDEQMTDETTGPAPEATDADEKNLGERPRRERSKVTGPDLEVRFNNWRAARRARPARLSDAHSPASRRHTRRKRLAIVLGLALAATAVLSAVGNRTYDQQSAANTLRISALETPSAPATDGARTPTVARVDSKGLAVLNARAAAAAKAVADKQQEYTRLFHAVNNAPGAGNGAPNEAVLKTVEHRRVLAPFWDPKSFVADERLAYSFTTTPYFGRDEMDPRFPWYVRYNGLKATDPKSYGWRVESVMPTLDAPTRAQVVWVCRDSKSTVLAWASATYADSTRTFSGLALVVTAAGRQQQPETDAAKAGRAPGLGEGPVQKP